MSTCPAVITERGTLGYSGRPIATPNSMSETQLPDAERLALCAREIAEAGRELGARGWTPATSSNFSRRYDDMHAAVTISGRDKGRLGIDDIMLVDLAGNAVGTTARPSAETLLHVQMYRRDPAIGAVLHTHSHNQTVASRLYAAQGPIRFGGFELQKAITGYDHARERTRPAGVSEHAGHARTRRPGRGGGAPGSMRASRCTAT